MPTSNRQSTRQRKAKVNTRELIIKTLKKNGPLTVNQIAKKCGKSYNTIHHHITKERKDNPGNSFRIVGYTTPFRESRVKHIYAYEPGEDVEYVPVDVARKIKREQKREQALFSLVPVNTAEVINHARRYAGLPWGTLFFYLKHTPSGEGNAEKRKHHSKDDSC